VGGLHGGHQGRSLFRQVYLHGLALLFLVTVALAAAGFFLGRDGRWRTSPARLAHHVGGILATAPDDAVPGLAARLADDLDVSLVVYGPDGRALASAGVPPSPAEAGASRHSRLPRFAASASAGSGRSVRLAFQHGDGEWMARIFGTLALVVAVVALVSAPLARAIARPIERLADAARRLGEGDLRARSGLTGRGEIGALGRRFDEMAERLEALLTAHRQLLADVSHELRTPLARMRVSLALAADAPQAPVDRHLKALEEDVVELEALVADLLTASRLDSGGRLVLRREPTDLRPLAEAAAERLRRLHPGRTVDLALADTPAVFAEGALVSRVLDNLLDNAARYSDQSIHLGLEREGSGALLSVGDRGTGLRPEDQARLFTPFFRTDESRNRNQGGAGLGLYLCQRIVAAHGGRIAIESAPGTGTVAKVWLPDA